MRTDRSEPPASADADQAALVRETTAECRLNPIYVRRLRVQALFNGVPYLCVYFGNAFLERFVKLSNNVSYLSLL